MLAVGGSVAAGWDDAPPRVGYLGRALQIVSQQLKVNIKFWNESISGYTAEKYSQYFPKVLKAYRPNVVIISWGLMNDISAKTPLATFESTVSQEVYMSIQSGAQVWVVTPPVTEATNSAKDSVIEEVYAGGEIHAAMSVVDPRIHVFDLMTKMTHYLKANHLSVAMYASNAWHPNSAGHELAGSLLAEAIIQRKDSLGL